MRNPSGVSTEVVAVCQRLIHVDLCSLRIRLALCARFCENMYIEVIIMHYGEL